MRAAILMPCWKSPELLEVCIPSLKQSMGDQDAIIVILNEADDESIRILDSHGIEHIDTDYNYGPSAVDLAIPRMNQIGFQYVANVNSDMLFSHGWVDELIRLLEANYPCSASASLVEPSAGGGQAIEKEIDFFSHDANGRFCSFVKSGKYKTPVLTNHYGHPILVKMEDFLSVNGYSDNMDKAWIEAKGRALDDWFAYRLKELHPDFKFLNSDKAFAYHAVSLNTKKAGISNPGYGASYFKSKTSITPKEFFESL